MPLPVLVVGAWGAAKGWAARSAAAHLIRGAIAATRTQRATEIKLITKFAAAQGLGMNSTNPRATQRLIENGINLIY